MTKKLLYFIFAISISTLMFGQSVEDVLRFSRSTYLGSARYMSAGGAFTALGNDFTAVHQNPAGLAVFRRSEINLAMGSLSFTSDGRYEESFFQDEKSNFLFSNLGIVIAFPRDDGWKPSFGISFNKNADFNSQSTFNANGLDQSRINMWLDQSQGIHPDDLLNFGLTHEWMAYQAYLTDADLSNVYTTQADLNSVGQIYTETTSGGLSEIAVTGAVEYENRLYLGGSINVPFINYEKTSVYQESNLGDSISAFQLKEYNQITGAGVNIKLGAQYRLDNGFRFGAAIHTPTWFTLEQNWEDEISTDFSNGSTLPEVISVYSDPYYWKMSSPWKGLLGIAKVFGKYGFLSVDYELNMMNSARAKSDSVDVSYLNPALKNYTTLSHIVRAGGEIRIKSIYLRGGYAFETNGVSIEEFSNDYTTISFGGGFRGKNISLGVAYSMRNTTQASTFYNASYANVAYADQSQNTLMFNLSYRFNSN